MFVQVCPMRRDRAAIHEWNGQEGIVKDYMILW
jgi:hypothetical protein